MRLTLMTSSAKAGFSMRWLASIALAASLLTSGIVRADDAELFSPSPLAFDGASAGNFSMAATGYQVVDVNTAALDQASFLMTLPDSVYQTTTSRAQISGDDASWGGALSRDGSDAGSATISVLNGYVAGYIETPDAVYELAPISAGVSALVTIDPSLFPPEHPPQFPQGGPVIDGRSGLPVSSASGHKNPEQPISDQTNSSTATDELVGPAAVNGPTVDILMIYTAATRAAAGGTAQIQTTLQAAVDATNQAYINSNVQQRMRIAHMAEVGFVEVATDNLGAALPWARDDAGVEALRVTHGADMIGMIVEDGSGFCGLGYVMRNVGAGFSNSAVGVTARGCAVGNLSFAHEAGHNMGLEHDPANGTSPANASYPYSFGHFVSGSYRTVMSYSNQCASFCPRRQYFSNPNVNYLGTATGIANQRHNQQSLNNTDATTAAFKVGKPEAVAIGATADSTPTYTWAAEWGATWYQLYVSGPGGLVHATWYRSSQTGCTSGTGNCSITPPHVLAPGAHTWWLRAWKTAEFGPWNAASNFTVTGGATPDTPSLIAPSGSTADTTPSYSWNASPGASWYYLWVNGPGGNVYTTWYKAGQAGCNTGSGTCTITPTTPLANGSHTWWVAAWNSAGQSAWSSPLSFAVAAP